MGVAVNYDMTGPDGAPVLVLGNALGTTTALWDRQLPALRERYRVLRFDNRGHGGSPTPAGPYAMDDLGQDALDLLDSLGLDQVDYCGVSMGGMVGMWLAAHAPDRVRRLVLCCTTACFADPDMWAARAEQVRAQGTGPLVETTQARWFTARFQAAEPAVVASMMSLLAGTSADGYAACCAAIGGMDLRPDLPNITAGTLVISGSEDPSTPPDHGAAIAEAIPGAQFLIVPEAAHLANVEAPEIVTDALIEHLES